ncbi:pyruvate formate lyase activating enzyme [Halanaerobium saccharolyticum]|uniref:Pyruvate formate lyase activating enzyme n=1 Tax=Halanaerobium saccharolyticum TaxID=43595 RepID=A0A4R7Z0I2_9FIRM|nr:AmmeMemoRadiSam system radical SAM enzyme [Halanaerobium saccharolyticum]RAK07754.1 pyruvate formate lyase activating enzyme [Halanaerobium saccharolyticum]TDW03637.1 pyruvate formate lyase activating enzyme [Halanaerobium saccharolyticum]TDX59476.1 pyruvate formate lyase activating enzyme [Halanaerobium saccharolyticum]
MNDQHPAKFYHLEEEELIGCELCPHNCVISNNKTGICMVRKNIEGELYTLNYGKVSSLGVDPVEKKPLYHFHPEAQVLSFGSWGCNMSCGFCQNWRISQQKPQLRDFQPAEVVETALAKNINLLAYTYSEPTIFYEYMFETAEIAHQKGLKNIMVSNGFINQKPLEELIPLLDAANIDLKAFNNDFYQQHCHGGLEAVKKTIKKLAEEKIHLEVTNLIITDLNDDLEELKNLFQWLAGVNSKIPLHLSRYHPAYKLDNPPTDLELMKNAYQEAEKYLDHVYLGNAIIENTADTFCPDCGARLIKRRSYNVENRLQNNRCPDCGENIYGEFV